MKIKIDEWTDIHTQRFRDGKGQYIIGNLISRAKDLPVKEMPIEHLNIYNLGFDADTLRKFVSHIKAIQACNLDHPIILDEDGYDQWPTKRDKQTYATTQSRPF